MSRNRWIFLILVVAIGAAGIWLGRESRNQDTIPAASDSRPPEAATLPSVAFAESDEVPAGSEIAELIAALVANGGADPSLSEALLDALREALLSMPPETATRHILDFLRSGRDAATGLDFSPGENGFLSSASSLRVFFMDLLEQINPAVAANYAAEIIHSTANSEEWAVALRTRHNVLPGSLGENVALLQNALANRAWVSAPSQGVLHALDLAAYAGDFGVLQRILELSESSGDPVWAEGLAVTMHRLAREHPAAMLEQLNADSGFLAEQPLARADLVAYADLANAEQRRLVEQRLGNPDVPQEEKEKILYMLVSPGEFAHEGLFTEAPPVPEPADEEARLVVVLDTFRDWHLKFPELSGTIREVAGYLIIE